jgi:hypothetical protein
MSSVRLSTAMWLPYFLAKLLIFIIEQLHDYDRYRYIMPDVFLIGIKTKNEKKEKRHLPPILNIFVPQTVHMPCVAGLPFFIVTFFSSFIVLLALHLTQYASVAMDPYTDGGKRSFPRAMAIAQGPASQ